MSITYGVRSSGESDQDRPHEIVPPQFSHNVLYTPIGEVRCCKLHKISIEFRIHPGVFATVSALISSVPCEFNNVSYGSSHEDRGNLQILKEAQLVLRCNQSCRGACVKRNQRVLD